MVSTPRRAVLGGEQNSPGNLTILPGIRRLGKFSGRHEVMKLKFWEISDFFGMSPQKFGKIYSRISGGLLFTPCFAQTAFVRAVIARRWGVSNNNNNNIIIIGGRRVWLFF